MKYCFLACILAFFPAQSCLGQSDSLQSFEGIAGRIFLPSLELGYQFHNSSTLGSAFVTKTSIEYRLKNNNDFFIRLSYDTYGARYLLPLNNLTTNTIEGTVQISDIFLAPGYRLGDDKFRCLFSIMSGIKLYEFPSATQENQQITISQDNRALFTSSALICSEYYFDQKTALTLSLHYNQVWKKVDFWADGIVGLGLSIGFITSLV